MLFRSEIVKIAAQGGSTKFTNPGNVTSGITNEISKQVLDALCFDYPYEMYWRGLEYGGGYSNEFNLYVAEEYKGANNQTVDAEKAKKASDIISNASGNAQKILNAAKDLPSPIAKLQYFKKAICDLVSYNHDAVENNTTYGNPWQMIWHHIYQSSGDVIRFLCGSGCLLYKNNRFFINRCDKITGRVPE